MITIILAFLAPDEEILGYSYKLIYLHLPLLYVSLLSLFVTLVFSFGALKKERFYPRARNAAVLGLILGVGTLITTAVFMTLAWGGIAWTEPRFRVMILTYLLFAVYIAVHRLNKKEVSAVYALVAGLLSVSAYYFMVTQSTFQLHPQGVSIPLKMRLPFFSSLGGFLILYYYLMEKMEKR